MADQRIRTQQELLLASAFREGYDLEMDVRMRLIQKSETPEGRLDITSRYPEYAELLEGETKDELIAEAPLGATAWGVAAAIRQAVVMWGAIPPTESTSPN